MNPENKGKTLTCLHVAIPTCESTENLLVPKSPPQKSVDQTEAILDFFVGILQRTPKTQTFSEPELPQPNLQGND